jgi:hypothetical protein
MNELELVRWGLVRIANLHWSMGDAEGADEVLNLLSDRVAQPGLKLVVAGVASASRLFENQLEEAVELSKLVLATPDASAAAVEWAVFGGALALALMGLGDEVEAVAERGHQVDDKVDGLLRYLTAFGEVRALVLSGDFDHRRTAFRGHRADHFCGPVSGMGHGQCSGWHGRVGPRPLRRRRLPHGADRRGADVGVGGLVELPGTPAARAVVLRARPHGGGRQDGRRAEDPQRQARRGLRPAAADRRGGLAAAEGNVSAAIEVALDAARLAAESKQTAIEMLALHDAARFGDATCLDRLADLATSIGGELASAIAAHAEAVRDHDAAKLAEAGQRFEIVGALLSAADAAAQAAVAFEATDNRRCSVEAAAAATRLAAECGGNPHTRPGPGRAPVAADRSRARDRQPGGSGAEQQGDRRPAGGVGPNGRRPPVSRLYQNSTSPTAKNWRR